MSLCDLNCCDLKWLQTKFDAINKKISDNKKLQDRINANIFKLIQESGIDVEKLLKNYYALNEEDYTKTLTSDDDVNTLEPGTYKIVKTDMPQNAPTGVASSNYDGTLIQSNSYAILFENGYLHIGSFFSEMNRFRWNHVINSNLINIHLQYYMLISRYSDGEFIDDIHTLSQRNTGVYIINSTTQNLPVQQNGIIIVRIGTATNSLFVTFIPEDSFDVYYCAKKADGTWTEWGQVAFMSDVPSLEGYATQEWVNQQIQDITGGSVTADWVKSNYYALTNNQYMPIPQNTDYNTLGPGCYLTQSSNLTNSEISSLGGTLLLIKFNTYYNNVYRTIIYNFTNNKIYFCDSTATQIRQIKQIAYMDNIPDLSGYVTQSWVQSQNYLTEIPDEYATDAEVTQAIRAALVGYATQAWVNEQISEITSGAVTTDIVTQMISDAIVGYATQAWVNSQGFLTEIPDEYVTITELQALNYATQSWVTGKSYQTSTQVDAAITKALNGYATQTWTKSNFYSLNKDLYSTINSNDDLNDYIEPGIYLCSISSITATLSNKPTGLSYSFKLIVEDIVGDKYVIQRIIENDTSNCYIRSCSGGAFKNWNEVIFRSDLNNYATKEWVGQQGYQTVQQVNSLIKNATNDMLTQEDLETFNYATENWVLQTALNGYATENWINTKLNNYLPKKETIALTTQGTYYGLQYQWVKYGQVVEVFLVGNLTQEISNQLISNFCPGNPMRTLQTLIPGYDDTKHYAEFNNDGLKLMGSYQNELYINCHFTYLTNE